MVGHPPSSLRETHLPLGQDNSLLTSAAIVKEDGKRLLQLSNMHLKNLKSAVGLSNPATAGVFQLKHTY